MKKQWFCFLLALIMLLSGCAKTTNTPPTTAQGECLQHTDGDDNGVCDVCFQTVLAYFDFYNINDLHGKLADADSHIGVDELTTYFKQTKAQNPDTIFISSGDMVYYCKYFFGGRYGTINRKTKCNY